MTPQGQEPLTIGSALPQEDKVSLEPHITSFQIMTPGRCHLSMEALDSLHSKSLQQFVTEPNPRLYLLNLQYTFQVCQYLKKVHRFKVILLIKCFPE